MHTYTQVGAQAPFSAAQPHSRMLLEVKFEESTGKALAPRRVRIVHVRVVRALLIGVMHC